MSFRRTYAESACPSLPYTTDGRHGVGRGRDYLPFLIHVERGKPAKNLLMRLQYALSSFSCSPARRRDSAAFVNRGIKSGGWRYDFSSIKWGPYFNDVRKFFGLLDPFPLVTDTISQPIRLSNLSISTIVCCFCANLPIQPQYRRHLSVFPSMKHVWSQTPLPTSVQTSF